MLRMVGDPWTIVCLELPTSGGNMLRMVGDHTPAKEDCSLCSLLWAPFPTSGRYIFFENGR